MEEEEIIKITKKFREHLLKLDKVLHKSNLDPTLVDTEDLMILFKVTSSTIYRWRKEKKLKYFKMGKKIFYRITEVEEYIAQYENNKQ